MFWAEGGSWTVVGQLAPVPAGSPEALATAARIQGGAAFPSGLVACFTYEAGAWFEKMPTPKPGRHPLLPPVWLGRITGAWVWDRRGTRVVAPADQLEPLLTLPVVDTRVPVAPTGRALALGSRARYERGVREIQRRLRAGDCYQVNLAREIIIEDPGDPFDAWLRLLTQNPSRRGLYLQMPHATVVSNSPELLLRVRRGHAWSVPIKGTAPRANRASGEPDPAAIRLLQSPKERAELTMIADLVRSDLARVAVPASVQAGPRRVGPTGHVWHAVRTIEADLAPGRDALDALGALFPAGSVTGAPKVRAMELIHDLEPGPRGVYCGSLGWFADNGDARFNVAIRTITYREGEASLHVGAGIVLGSDPAQEYRETELKAQRLLGVLCR